MVRKSESAKCGSGSRSIRMDGKAGNELNLVDRAFGADPNRLLQPIHWHDPVSKSFRKLQMAVELRLSCIAIPNSTRPALVSFTDQAYSLFVEAERFRIIEIALLSNQ